MGKQKDRKKKHGKKRGARPHRHYLYSAAVQSAEADLKFFRRVYKRSNGRSFHRLREDFCGTAVLACDWVRRGAKHEAWGVDLDRKTLDWGRKRYLPRLGERSSRLHLLCEDVRKTTAPKVDLVAALNFSYSVFKTREGLGDYFRQVRRSLDDGGVFVLDAWGGQEAMGEEVDKRKVEAETAFDGTKIPAFTYVWEQARFNPIDHDILCHIHFRLRDGTKLKRAFTYDWRLWTLPELRELLEEAGFESSEVYTEGWDDDEDEADGVFRRRSYFENQEGWVAYVVGYA
jgi:cyclopropane fatty-acyl-phospholipid synthase-like methyltransferase